MGEENSGFPQGRTQASNLETLSDVTPQMTKEELESHGWKYETTFGYTCQIWSRNRERVLVGKDTRVYAHWEVPKPSALYLKDKTKKEV